MYLLQLGFHLVAVVGRLVQRYKQYTKRCKNTEYTKWDSNIQNKKEKYKKNIKQHKTGD